MAEATDLGLSVLVEPMHFQCIVVQLLAFILLSKVFARRVTARFVRIPCEGLNSNASKKNPEIINTIALPEGTF